MRIKIVHLAFIMMCVMMPRNVPYNYEDISSLSGYVGIASIAGQVRAQSLSGRIQIQDVRDAVNVNSISGDVIVHAPADLDAYVDLSTLSGSLWTDFPIRIFGRWPFGGQSARGRLGSGATSLKISSIAGRVCLSARTFLQSVSW